MGLCRTGIKKIGMDVSGRAKYLAVFINILGSMTAGSINCVLMRRKELQGVKVVSPDLEGKEGGEDLGMSKNAGKKVIKSMAFSRCMLSFFCGIIPLFLIMAFSRLPF